METLIETVNSCCYICKISAEVSQVICIVRGYIETKKDFILGSIVLDSYLHTQNIEKLIKLRDKLLTNKVQHL